MGIGLRRGDQRRTEYRTLRAERQHGRQIGAVGKAASREDRKRCFSDDLGKEIMQRPIASHVAARLNTLRDDDLRAGLLDRLRLGA